MKCKCSPTTSLDAFSCIRCLSEIHNLWGSFSYATPYRVRAHCISDAEYRGASMSELEKIIRALYKDQQVYTHVDVYSPVQYGENLMFRIKV